MLVFLFTDIEGSSRLWERYTAEMGEIITRHDAILQEQIGASGGRITKHTGDGVTAVFEGGEPVACALQAQRRFAAESWGHIGELRIRAGLHAGAAEWIAGAEYQASTGTPGGDYFGPPVNATARVMSAAWGGQILLTPEVTSVSPLPAGATLLDLGEHLLKNVSAPQQLYQLEHPQLPWHEFPPPRTLSGQSIRRAVDERGRQLAGLDPTSMALGLVSAILLPALQGELDPESGALEGNLGVLGDLGAGTLRAFTARFAGSLRARQGAGEAPGPLEIQAMLDQELLAQWQMGGERSAALRADASRLLQSVQGVEAALQAATAEVKEALTRGLADLGGRFREFHWMLDEVARTLAEMRTRQALQLALQREQLDLQSQQLVKTQLLLQLQQERAAALEPVGPAEAGEEQVSPADVAPADVACPYKGLAAFEPEDAEYFFGREELVAELTARLAGTRFLAVVGASGSGKSSAVRAGLLPAIWGDALPGSKEWRTIVLTPGHHPLNELAARISLLDGFAPVALLKDLEADHRALDLAVRRVLAGQPQHVRLLLVVDQFEEVFALCRNGAERHAFIDALLYAVEAETSRTVVVATIRADYYGHCADYPSLVARLRDNVLVGPLSEGELRQAIERPAERVGLRLEPGLADTIVDDVAGEPGALPLMSHALLETWGRRRERTLTLSGYAASGGVAGAIAQTADNVFGQFSPEKQATARNIFLRLTELGEEGTQDTRRRVVPGELVRRAEEEPVVASVLRTLADARLITMGGDPVLRRPPSESRGGAEGPVLRRPPSESRGGAEGPVLSTVEGTVEVAHEALIREWPALRGWLDEDREGLRIHRHLTEAAMDWEALDREPGELYRGARLVTAGEWAVGHADELNPLERAFLDASQEMARREEEEREAQRLRELEAARKVAEAERNRAEEQARATRRFRRLAAVLAVVFLLAAAAAVFALWQQQQAQQQARVATSRELAAAALNNLDVDPERSVLLALQGLSEAHTLEAENALHASIPELHLLLTLTGFAKMVESIAVSPDGVHLATASDDGTVEVWDVTTGQELLSFSTQHTGLSIFGMAYSPDGARLATASDDGTARVWDAATGRQLLVIDHGAPLSGLAFSPDGKQLATAGADAAARVWDSAAGQQVLALTGHGDAIRAGSAHPGGVIGVLFAPDGKGLVTAGADGTARLWDAATGQALRVISDHTDEIYIALSPDGQRLMTAGYDGFVKVWDISPGAESTEPLLTIDHGQAARAAAFGPDGMRIAAASQDGAARVWDAASGRKLLTLAGHAGLVDDLAFTTDGTRLVTTGEDKTVRVWDLAPGKEVLTLVDAAAPAYSPDGQRLATAQPDGTVAIRDSTTGQVLLTLAGHPEVGAGHITFSPDAEHLATASWDTTAKLWDAVTGKELFTLSGHTGFVFEASYNPDGTRLATASADGTAKVWDTRTGREVFTLPGHGDWVQGIKYSPDGTRIAATVFGGPVRFWDAATGQELMALDPGAEVVGIAFSPDGKRLAASRFDGGALVWDIAGIDLPAGTDPPAGTDLSSGAESPVIFTLFGHAAFTPGVAFSPDGAHLATASFDGTAKVWDMGTGQEWLTLTAPDALASVAFSPDGAWLATGGFGAGQVSVHALDLEELVALAESRVTRSLTDEECRKFLHAEQCPASGRGGE
jgi:WD40 repeat protein/class 3 adenylate cyclase